MGKSPIATTVTHLTEKKTKRNLFTKIFLMMKNQRHANLTIEYMRRVKINLKNFEKKMDPNKFIKRLQIVERGFDYKKFSKT